MTLSRGDQQDSTGGYAAAPLLRRDHAGSGGRLGGADGGAGAGGGGGSAAQTAAATPTQTP